MSIEFELPGAADNEVLVRLARAFHSEDGHPLDDSGEAALREIARSESFDRSWIVRVRQFSLTSGKRDSARRYKGTSLTIRKRRRRCAPSHVVRPLPRTRCYPRRADESNRGLPVISRFTTRSLLVS